mmetsp:Transcript_19840/g.64531  ORF Transcript_19840/g.64531 Transcript_19840/m.64531 type:complete len:245 (-) Transcript_19840:1164-1898(-)
MLARVLPTIACAKVRGRGGSNAPSAMVLARRRALLALVSGSVIGTPLARAAEYGVCEECTDVERGVLGTCGASEAGACVSVYDDRPAYFVAPWEFESSRQSALAALVAAIEAEGGEVADVREPGYVLATFPSVGVEAEWVLADPREDAVATIRATALEEDAASSSSSSRRRPGLLSGGARRRGACRRAVEAVRLRLGWAEVPIIRNRERKLFIVETPFDNFGPEPPPDLDVRDMGLTSSSPTRD